MWSLLEAIDLAEQVESLSTRAMLDGTCRMVRRRFDDRPRPGGRGAGAPGPNVLSFS
jgi:hypothetical protein